MGERVARLIICEDDPNIRSMLEVLLVLEGHDVSCANDGAALLELLIVDRDFDLILLDVMMPRMSGWEAAEQIRDNPLYPQIPIVFTTAKEDDQSQWYGWDLGASSYLVKPYNINDLLAEVDRIVCAGV